MGMPKDLSSNESAPGVAAPGANRSSGNGPFKRSGYWLLGILFRAGITR